MNLEILVSVIIPTYNRGILIKETIDSVLNQTHSNFEILICDDGSTDNTESIVKEYNDPRISYYKLVHRGMPAPPRNHGIMVSRGKYIAFLDSDDLWFPEKLEKQIEILEKNAEILAVCTNKVNYPGNLRGGMKLKNNKILTFEETLKNNLIYNSSVLLRRTIIDNIGLLDESETVKAAEDLDFWLRILYFKDNSFFLLKEPLLKYRIHSGMISELDGSKDYYMTYFHKQEAIFKKFSNFDQKILKKILSNHYKIARSVQLRYDFRENKIKIKDVLCNKEIGMKLKIKTILHKYFIQ